MAEFSFSEGARRWKHPNTPDSDYEHLFDGDVYSLTPGVDFGTINAFRVRLNRMCYRRQLRYATRVVGDKLEVVIYRKLPGDLLKETLEAATAAPEPSPGQ